MDRLQILLLYHTVTNEMKEEKKKKMLYNKKYICRGKTKIERDHILTIKYDLRVIEINICSLVKEM